MKKALILQGRPEKVIKDSEFQSILDVAGRSIDQFERHDFWEPDLLNIDIHNFACAIVLGSPYNILDDEQSMLDDQRISERNLNKIIGEILESDFPYYGLCYGLTYIVKLLGNKSYVTTDNFEPSGIVHLTINPEINAQNEPILKNIPSQFDSAAGHKEQVKSLPNNVINLGSTEICKYAFVKYKHNIYGSQFHSELTLNDWVKRVHTYRDFGYFDNCDVNKLIDDLANTDLTHSHQIMINFLNTYLP